VAVAVYRNVNAVTHFCYAEDGTVVANFDPIHAQDRWFFEQASPQVLALLDQAGITPRAGEDEDDFDFVEAMFALAEATGVRLDRASIAEQPLLCSSIRNPFSDFVGDLLSRGGDERTASLFLTLLDDRTQKERVLRLLNDWLQREQFSHLPKQIESLRTVVVRMLSALQSVQVTLALLNMLGAGNEEVRATASQVLKILLYFEQRQEQEGARERFLLLVAAPEPEIARQAALALGGLGDQRAVEPLLRLLPLDPDKREIIQLLGQLRASSAAEPLFSRLNPHNANIDV
jgi:HEAT repeat protein